MKVCCRKDCEYAGEPQSLANFGKLSRNKDGLRYECKSCRKKDLNKPEYLAWKKDYGKKYFSDPEYKKRRNELNQEPHRRDKRIRYAQEYNSRNRVPSDMQTNFYAGYVWLGDTPYFKIGITRQESMERRYKIDPAYREVLGDVIQLKWVKCDSQEKALDLEQKHKLKCRNILGEPAKGYEWFCIPNDAQLKNILEGE